ncbi:MAG: multicopper oxidase domain-containing protein [Myxococcota bacterium]
MVAGVLALAPAAFGQDSSILVQCPETTDLHPTGEGITCFNLTGGDGMVTMADDIQRPLYVFGFSTVPEGGPAVNSPEYPGYLMDNGTLAANAPAPTLEVDEDDEVFLTLTNVGMAMRPDLFDAHSVHWHGFPQAASIFDGVPDSSVAIGMGASVTYYYNAKDAGTYLYHCHVEATEHMQMGMLGSLYVRPRQDRLPDGTDLAGHVHHTGDRYAYNDGDGSTRYDVAYPVQISTFDPAFHDASFSVQPLPFASMRDTYFLLNGRGYPDTVNPDVLYSEDPLGRSQPSQPVSSLITAAAGERVLLRISNVSVTQFNTIATNGIPMTVVGLDARLLRDQAGNNLSYQTQSLTLGGGQSADVILDTSGLAPGSTYFLYTTNLHQLANDVENFGGLMTEIRVE